MTTLPCSATSRAYVRPAMPLPSTCGTRGSCSLRDQVCRRWGATPKSHQKVRLDHGVGGGAVRSGGGCDAAVAYERLRSPSAENAKRGATEDGSGKVAFPAKLLARGQVARRTDRHAERRQHIESYLRERNKPAQTRRPASREQIPRPRLPTLRLRSSEGRGGGNATRNCCLRRPLLAPDLREIEWDSGNVTSNPRKPMRRECAPRVTSPCDQRYLRASES